jgi:hypothetical protein
MDPNQENENQNQENLIDRGNDLFNNVKNLRNLFGKKLPMPVGGAAAGGGGAAAGGAAAGGTAAGGAGAAAAGGTAVAATPVGWIIIAVVVGIAIITFLIVYFTGKDQQPTQAATEQSVTAPVGP